MLWILNCHSISDFLKNLDLIFPVTDTVPDPILDKLLEEKIFVQSQNRQINKITQSLMFFFRLKSSPKSEKILRIRIHSTVQHGSIGTGTGTSLLVLN
jgi:hypothetical protein